MKRSVERIRLSTCGVAPGELVVVTEFTHPVRGRVRCPAAPLLKSGLDGARVGTVPDEPGDAVLSAVSYVDSEGVTGFGIATSDPAAAIIADEVVSRWAAVLRTRRVLLAEFEPACQATCPLVDRMRSRLREFAGRGDAVVLIAKRGHAVAATLARGTHLVERPDEVRTLPAFDPERVSFLVAPGMPIEDAARVLAALRVRFPRLRGQHPDEWCYAASDQRETVRSVAAASDLLLLCGPVHDLRGRILTEVGEIRPDWLATAATVGIAGGPSELVDAVLRALSGLGPLSVARRRVSTEIRAFAVR
ncbi:hypothetical protein [Amycolatopsis sp. NPDC059657]|uniref:hypothetical protein n=1 Tax=Amycolatopsis sp. NPDC059657 TaxID=3346899 RepID=UPI00366DD088